MANILVEKNVLFVGVWRTPNITDALLKSVAMQKGYLKGYPSKLQITTGGLLLYVLNSSGRTGRTDLIPIQTVYDITCNRHDPLCLLCVFSDVMKRINLLVCYCINDIDASHIVETFKQYKKSLSGEGFNFDLKRPEGKNWTLKTNNKEVVRATVTRNNVNVKNVGLTTVMENATNGVINTGNEVGMNDTNYSPTLLDVDHDDIGIPDVTLSYGTPLFCDESTVEREELSHDGIIFYNVGIQTNGVSDEDEIVSTTSHSSAALRAELNNLTQEIRDIKLILEEATGISAAEYLRRHKLHQQNEYVSSQQTVWQRVHVDEKNDDPLLFETRPVNISNLPDHDARSYGTQTLPKQKYARKDHKSHKFHSGGGTANAIRSRLKIDTSNHMYQNTDAATNRQNIQNQQIYYQQDADVNTHVSAYMSEPIISTKTKRIKAKTYAKAADPNNNEKSQVARTTIAMPASMRIRQERKRAKTDKKYHSLKLNSFTVEKPIEDVYGVAHNPRKPHHNHRNRVLVYPSMATDWNQNHEAGYAITDAGYTVHAEVPDHKSTIYQKDMEIVEVELRPVS